MKILSQLFLLIAFCSAISYTQIPRTLSYQGVLTDAAGNPRPDSSYNFTFSLYDSGSGGTLLWSEAKSLPTKRGLFSTVLGDATPFPDSLKFDRPYWLNISVSGIGELSPRIPLTSVGYSMNALRADTAKVAQSGGAWSDGGANIYRLNGNVGIGTPSPDGLLSLRESNQVLNFLSNKKLNGSWPPTVENTTYTIQSSGSLYGNIAFATGNFERMRVTSDGKIGIGTATPDGLLSLVWNRNVLNILANQKLTGNWPPVAENTTYTIQSSGASSGNLAFAVGNSEIMRISSNGNVGIGTGNPSTALDVIGHTRTQVLEITGGSDLAEPFPVSEESQLEEGSVVVIDESNAGHVTLSTEPYDKKVAGVVSGAGGIKPGLTLKQEGLMEGDQNVALSGRVYVKATASNGSIKPGDRLVTSSIPGLCMKATDPSQCDGAVIGKAMSALELGEGLVLVLINLQ